MYKGKVGYWVSIISVVLVIQFCLSVVFPWMGTWFHEDSITVSANTQNVDPSFLELLGNQTLNDFYYDVESKNSDFYFADSSVDYDNEGYKKYSDYLYSPLVMYVRYSVYNNSNGFIRLDPEKGSSGPLQIDLYDILEAMEQGKEWKDIGISTKVVKGPVVVTIPNSRSYYYDEVVELFYMTLNDLKVPTEEDYVRLKPRVENILSKCEQISDISQGMIAEYDKHSSNYKVFIGPEYLFARGGDETGRQYEDQFNPIYFMNTVFLKMDMYVNENIIDETRKEVVDNALYTMLHKHGFYNRTGWRFVDSYLSMGNSSNSLANTVIGY